VILEGSAYAVIGLLRVVLFSRFDGCFEAAWRGGYIFSFGAVGRA
jgi:hypothetical protein